MINDALVKTGNQMMEFDTDIFNKSILCLKYMSTVLCTYRQKIISIMGGGSEPR
jgi:hypothetical protein